VTIIYKTNLFVQREIKAQYRAWLSDYIFEILSLSGFIDAKYFDMQQEPGVQAAAICVHYRLHSLDALVNYFQQHTARMRTDSVANIGGCFLATRGCWPQGRVGVTLQAPGAFT
jgi:hypothetical protein